MNNLAFDFRGWRILVWLVLIAALGGMTNEFIRQMVYLNDNDGLYYLAVGDGLRQTGKLQNLCSEPPGPPVTPQNAVAVLHVLLYPLIPSGEGRLIALVWINSAILLISTIPLLRLSRRLGVNSGIAQAAIVAVYICSWHTLRYQLSPLNDGLFRTGALWLMEGILCLRDIPSHVRMSSAGKGIGVGVVLMSILLIHFRLNAVVIPAALLATAILLKQKRTAALSLITGIPMLFSLFIPYLWVDTHEITALSSVSWDTLIPQFPKRLWIVTLNTTPSALFRDMGTCGNMLYAGFAVAMAGTVIDGWRKRQTDVLFLSLVCVLTFGFLMSFCSAPLRLMLMIIPLLYLFLLRSVSFRSIGYVFIFAVLIQSALYFYDGIRPDPLVRFWAQVRDAVGQNPERSFLITDYPRHGYFFTGMRCRESPPAAPDGPSMWYVGGSDDFVREWLKKNTKSAASKIHTETLVQQPGPVPRIFLRVQGDSGG
jgi:hypothetical protein